MCIALVYIHVRMQESIDQAHMQTVNGGGGGSAQPGMELNILFVLSIFTL